MISKFEYRLVAYDRSAKIEGETEVDGVLKLLNANGSQGYELDRFEDSPDNRYRWIWMKRKIND